MTVSGFPDALQFSRLNSAITELRSQSEVARIELVTGRVADIPTALGARTGEGQLVLKALDDLVRSQSSIQQGLSRAGVTQLILTNIAEPTATLAGNLLTAVTIQDETGIGLATEQARSDLESAISRLNQQFAGQSLFAGDATDQPALGDIQTLINDVAAIYTGAADAAQFTTDIDAYFNDPAGGFATGFYNGGAGNAPSSEIGNGEIVNANAKADEQEIRDVLRELATIAVAGTAPETAKRDAILSQAGTGLINAGANLTEIRSRIGVVENRLQVGLDQLDVEQTVLNEHYNDLTAVDQFEAASRLQQLETQLAASFTISSRISQLSLVNFL